MLAVKIDLPCQLIKSPTDLEVVCVRLNLPCPITYCIIYIPPNSSASYCDKSLDFLSDICSTSERLIILGDFNLPDIQWDLLSETTHISQNLCELVFHTGLVQFINEPTHIHGNILDLLLTNIDDSIKLLEVHRSSLIPLTLPLVLLSTVMFSANPLPTTSLITLQVTTLASVTTSCMLTLHPAI